MTRMPDIARESWEAVLGPAPRPAGPMPLTDSATAAAIAAETLGRLAANQLAIAIAESGVGAGLTPQEVSAVIAHAAALELMRHGRDGVQAARQEPVPQP